MGNRVGKLALMSLLAFFLSHFWGCAEVKTYITQREQEKALENLKRGSLQGQRYRNQLYECEIQGPENWKAELAYPEALVVYTQEDKITRIKLEVRELDEEKEKKELKDFIAEREKTPTYKKIREKGVGLGKTQALEVVFEGHWREEAKSDSIRERAIYVETKKYIFIISFYTLDSLWDRKEEFFNETLKRFTIAGKRVVEVSPTTRYGTSTPPKPKEIKTTPPPVTPPKSAPCNFKNTGKVTAVSDNQISFNLGSQHCIRIGMTGRIYYERIIAGDTKKIYIARFKVTTTSPQTSDAQVIESTDTVKTDYWILIDKK